MHLHEPFEALLGQVKFLFIQIDGSKVPFRINTVEVLKDLIIHFQSIENLSRASSLTSRTVFLPEDEVPSDFSISVEELHYDFVKGFSLIVQGTKVGEVKEIRQLPQQQMAVIQSADREILIPLHDDLITEIDEESKELKMELADGLLDL